MEAGATREDYEAEVVECWPENWESYAVFMQIRTQWRTTMGGVVGLDYGPLFTVMDRMRLDDERWQTVFADIRALEAGALGAINER